MRFLKPREGIWYSEAFSTKEKWNLSKNKKEKEKKGGTQNKI